MKIKKIGAKSVAKIGAAVYGLLGLIGGVIISIGTLASGQFTAPSSFLGLGAIILMPIAYAVIGFLGGYISVWLYNMVAKKIGGIEMEIEE